MSILDQLAVKQPHALFRPTSVREVFLLRLAQKLGEPSAVEHYAELAGRHCDATLLLAYRRAINHRPAPEDLGKRFHAELAVAKEQEDRTHIDRLLAIKVERRCIAIALFVGNKLDFHDVHNLSSHADKAQASAIGFLNWVISSFDIESAALEHINNGTEIRRVVLNHAVLSLLRASGIPVWEVSKQSLLAAFGHPPLGTRIELREVAHAGHVVHVQYRTSRTSRNLMQLPLVCTSRPNVPLSVN